MAENYEQEKKEWPILAVMRASAAKSLKATLERAAKFDHIEDATEAMSAFFDAYEEEVRRSLDRYPVREVTGSMAIAVAVMAIHIHRNTTPKECVTWPAK